MDRIRKEDPDFREEPGRRRQQAHLVLCARLPEVRVGGAPAAAPAAAAVVGEIHGRRRRGPAPRLVADGSREPVVPIPWRRVAAPPGDVETGSRRRRGDVVTGSRRRPGDVETGSRRRRGAGTWIGRRCRDGVAAPPRRGRGYSAEAAETRGGDVDILRRANFGTAVGTRARTAPRRRAPRRARGGARARAACTARRPAAESRESRGRASRARSGCIRRPRGRRA